MLDRPQFELVPSAFGSDARLAHWCWRQHGAELVADDVDVTADVVFVECAAAGEFEMAVEEYGPRCCCVVAVLLWGEREAVLAMTGERVVRYKPRPYMPDAIVAVWEQQE